MQVFHISRGVPKQPEGLFSYRILYWTTSAILGTANRARTSAALPVKVNTLGVATQTQPASIDRIETCAFVTSLYQIVNQMPSSELLSVFEIVHNGI
jgi:hypothetical protein